MRETDLRVIKTKNTIRQCFFELLKKKPFEDISIKELCEMAKCSRNTFYSHYQYKDNLYNQIVDECITEILQGFRPLTRTVSEQTDEINDQYMYNFLKGVYTHADTLRVLIASDHNGSFQARLTERLVDILVLISEQSSGWFADTDEWWLVCSYNAGAFVAFSMFWLRKPEISFDRAREILRDLMDSSMHMGEKYLSEKKATR